VFFEKIFLRFKNIYFGCHGNQSSVWNLILLTTLVELHARNILAKWFRRSCCLMKLLRDGCMMNDRQWAITKAHLEDFVLR